MSLRSLRWQIQLWHAALLVVLVGSALVAFFGYERRARVARIDAELTGPLVALLPRHIRLPGRTPPNTYDATKNNTVERALETTGHYIRVTAHDGRSLYVSPGAPDSAPVDLPEQNDGIMRGRWNGDHRELVNISPRGDVLILARHSASLAAELREFTVKLALLGAGIVGLGLVGGYFIANRAMHPLRTIGDTARRIASGNWNERIPADQAPAELEQLRSVLNDSFGRLATTYEQQRRFTADASHELGTPVAIILGNTQLALSRPRSSAEYMDALAACQRAGERMQALHTALLDLASLDAATAPRRRVECDLSEIALEAVSLITARAEERRARIHTDLTAVTARVDPLGIGQILINLLNNALTHNAPGVVVTLRLQRVETDAIFTVSDSGIGIPDAALPHLFERFYRADAARTRSAGGSGLGLSIAFEIVRLHNGSISAENQSAGGAVFTVRLPVGTASTT